jgi:peptidoglycan/xylan/chitin deacetylase (PgdA/CDA1 family)
VAIGKEVRTRLLAGACVVAILATMATPGVASAAASTVVSITFDNGMASQYSLGYLNALQPHGDHATFFVSSGSVGAGPGFMTWPQLSALQSGGNEIGGKTTSFTDLTAVTPDAATTAVCGDRATLVQHSLTPVGFAYPYGAFNAAAENIVKDCGYGNARTAGGISSTGPNYVEMSPPADFLATAAYAPSGAVSLADLQAVVNGASAQGGGWTQIVLQNVCSEPLDPGSYSSCKSSGGNVELDDLNAFLDWVGAAGQAGGAPSETVLQTVGGFVRSVDTIVPATSITCGAATCASDPYDNYVMVGFTATDEGSGVAGTHYTTDGSVPSLSSPTFTEPIKLSSSATVRFGSWDNAGNAGPIGSADLQVVAGPPDTTPPTTTIACNGAPCSASPYTQAVTVSLSATDGSGSGPDKTYYTIDGSVPTQSSSVFTGSFDVEKTTVVRFFSTDLAANAEASHTQQVQITPSPVNVTLSWDDGKYNLYNLAWLKALKPHNVKSTFYVNSGIVGSGVSGPNLPGYMTWGNLATLYAGGNEIGGHTVDHVNLVNLLDDASRIHQVCDDRQALINHGLHPTSFAYPEGALNSSIETIVQNCGYANARSGGGLTPNGPSYAETLPPADPFATRAWASPGGLEIKLADLQAEVLAASSHGGGWLQLQGHVVCSQQYFPADYADCTAFFGWMQLTTLNAFLDWMQLAGQPAGAPAGAVFKTVRQVIGPLADPDIAPPSTAITCNGAACLTTTYGTTVTVALNATDTGSGVDRTLYTTDGTDPVSSATAKLYTAPFALSTTTTVRYFSTDKAMNAETSHTQVIKTKIDTTAPVSTIKCNAATCGAGWYIAVTVTLSATDTGGSGLDVTRYTTDGTAPTTLSPVYTAPFQVTQTTTVSYASWDKAGNKEATKTRLIRIDGVAPTVALTSPLSGASIKRSASQIVAATATDLGSGTGAPSGIASVAFYLDGSLTPLGTDKTNPYQFTWKPTLVALGTHTLKAVATDSAGNLTTSALITITITV